MENKIKRDTQDEYDELGNILRVLRDLIYDVEDEDRVQYLKNVKHNFEDEFEIIRAKLIKEHKEE